MTTLTYLDSGVLISAVRGNPELLARAFAVFAKVQAWAPDVAATVSEGLRIARTFGLAAVDALHVAASIQAGAAELITTEKPDKPIFRVTGVRVVSLQA